MSESEPKIADQVAASLDADVLLYAGAIWYGHELRLLDALRSITKPRANVLLILGTYGGLPDVAYRIARFLRRRYLSGKIYLFVSSECMSAGSLIAFAADEIIMRDEAELGPIDIQVRDKEEAGEMSSGLTPLQALDAIRGESWNLFKDVYRRLRSETQFSTKLAASVASRIVIGSVRPLYEQLDPLRIAQNRRAVGIVSEYGTRIKSANVKDSTISRMIATYPSHGFVIDREEVAELFNIVREPTDLELKLAEEVSDIITSALEKNDLIVADVRTLSSERAPLTVATGEVA